MRLASFVLLFLLTVGCLFGQLQAQTIPGDARLNAYLPMLEGQRVGVVCNHTAALDRGDGTRIHLIDTLLARGVQIEAAFGPEHGFRGDLPDGERTGHGKDPRTGIPVYSLYGTHRKPTAAQLRDLDLVLFDIQDVGVRCYTFLSTLILVMEACAEQDIPVLVLDRPNPNGHVLDGPVLDTAAVRSFVGFLPIPLAHGMTLGELATMANGEGWLGGGYSDTPDSNLKCELTVIPCKGWSRHDRWSPPVAPSPNLPSAAAMHLYPHLVLLEATVASIGRGTDEPFTLVGFPGMPQGVHVFTPQPNAASKYPKHAGQSCTGYTLHRRLGSWQAHRDDHRLHLEVLLELSESWNDTPAGDQSPFIDRPEFFDLLAGGPALRKALESGASYRDLAADWQGGLEIFIEQRSPYLRYPKGR